MHDISRREGRVSPRPAVFALILMLLLAGAPRTPAHAAESVPEEPLEAAVIRETVEDYLRRYAEASMLYEPRDLRAGTVAAPGLVPSPEDEARTYRVSGQDMTLAQLRENIAFLEKKAAYYAGMRQMQDIYREDLTLAYTFQKLTVKDGVCLVQATEAAGFRYTDSDIPSVNETVYTLHLIQLDGRWLIASVTDGSAFDSQYKKRGGSFDADAALAELAMALEREDCRVAFPYLGSTAPDRIYYDGTAAAAYACTYARRGPEDQRSDYYNPLFASYAGQGGDCMNFGSQCMWAGFGGSETAGAVSGRSRPMDPSGSSLWYGRTPDGGSAANSWISCQSFRKYLTGTTDASGAGGSNAGQDPGMYATILHVGGSAPLTGVEPEELVGAVAHVEGTGGNYCHTIVITAAGGSGRNQIWFCGHTKNVSNVKLGDCYTCPMKVYIPRYMRTGTNQENALHPLRIQPVAAGESGVLGAWTEAPQYRMWLQVTAPDGETVQAGLTEGESVCQAEYAFTQPGLYRVECFAMAAQDAAAAGVTYYVRCYAPEEAPAGEGSGEEAPPTEEGEGTDLPEPEPEEPEEERPLRNGLPDGI